MKKIIIILLVIFSSNLLANPKVQVGISNLNNYIFIKAKPNENIQTGFLSACVFTIKYLTAYNINLTNDSSAYGIGLITTMTNGNYTYKFYGTASGSTSFNWLANNQYEIFKFKVTNGIGNGNFEIANDSFTINNNGEFYMEHNVFGDITNYNLPIFNQSLSGVPLPIINTTQKKEDSDGLIIYPNPFNISTVFEFNLTKSSFVDIRVSNFLGQIIKSFHFENLNPSNYKFPLEFSNISSGVYYAILQTNRSIFYKKLILIK